MRGRVRQDVKSQMFGSQASPKSQLFGSQGSPLSQMFGSQASPKTTTPGHSGVAMR